MDKLNFLDSYRGMKTVRTKDTTFVITKGEYPYHVIQSDPLYEELLSDYENNPDTWQPELSPKPYVPTREETIMAELAAIDREYRTPRTIADAQVGDEEAIERLRTAYELSKPLRAELKAKLQEPEDD